MKRREVTGLVAFLVLLLLLLGGGYWVSKYAPAPKPEETSGGAATAPGLVAQGVPATGPGVAAGSGSAMDLAKIDANYKYKFQTVDLSGVANTTVKAVFADCPDMPIGDVTLGGVPFSIPKSGGNCWWCLTRPGLVTLEIAVGIDSVGGVDTLLNTNWGRDGLETTKLEFFGDKGAKFEKVLVGGVDIRDFNDLDSVNSINGTTTTEVWTGHGVKPSPFDRPTRMDKQTILLPETFWTQKLEKIVLTDSGRPGVSRSFIYGVTVGK